MTPKTETRITSPDKVLFPRDGITKLGMIEYYDAVADVMLPYMKHHPLAMLRYNGGIDKEKFFHKNAPDYFPEFIARAPFETAKRTTMMPVVNNPEALLYIANQNCIEYHVLPVLADDLWHPDRMIFDLDPSTDDFDEVRQSSLWLRDLLHEFGLTAFVMTSGSRGLHIWVPLDRAATVEEVNTFAHRVAELIAAQHPDVLTTEFHKAERKDRIYVDVGRNAPGQHAVTPYSLRAKDGAPVAFPIDWDEVADRDLTPTRYRLADVPAMVAEDGDRWKGMRRRAKSLAKANEKLQRLAPA
jgi:bifunctional non-homologous end joining protein LigD